MTETQRLKALRNKKEWVGIRQMTTLENAYHELELLGFPLSISMFDLLKTAYRGDITAGQLMGSVGKIIRGNEH